MIAGHYKGYKYPEGTHWTHEVKMIQRLEHVKWKEALAIRKNRKLIEERLGVSKPKKVTRKVTSKKVTPKITQAKNNSSEEKIVSKQKRPISSGMSEADKQKLSEQLAEIGDRLKQEQMHNLLQELWGEGKKRKRSKK